MKDDDQQDNPLIDSLKQSAPAADSSAKKRAIALAMAEFDLAKNQSSEQIAEAENATRAKKLFSFQGFLEWCRLSSGNHPQANSSRSDTMKISKKFFIGSLTTASVAIIGLVILQKPNSPFIESQHTPLVVNDNYVAPQTQASPTVVSEVKDDAQNDEVILTGIRADLAKSIDVKRDANGVVDAISSEDIGKFPDANAAEAMNRIPNPVVEKTKPMTREEFDVRMAEAREEAKENGSLGKAKLARQWIAAAKSEVPAKPALAPAPQSLSEPSLIGGVDKFSQDTVVQKQEEFRDRFEEFKDNSVKAVAEEPVSTFSIDVDTASYSFVRRMLNNGQLPSKDAVRSEELINYFDYHYPVSSGRKTPFTTSVNLMDSPWKRGNKLIHVAIQGYQIPVNEIPQTNLVFLLDVSGSMSDPDKLPLVKQSMSLLLDSLQPTDTVSIVVYAGAAGTVLEPTKVKDKTKILAALNNLQAGGSTAGAEGINLAYQLAEANFNAKGVNRIILATDGDFNVGQTDDSSLQDLVERKREKGIFLSVLGFGQGNYQDAMMQTLAQNGNGTAAYIDTLSEAQKVLVTEATSNLFPIAKDVKIQVEFNPNTVSEYRLIGYETRALNREDFANDKIDAGEIGAGQRVTAIYEITPKDAKSGLLEPSRYQSKSSISDKQENEYAFVRLRYKLPKEDKSTLVETPVPVKAKEMSGAMQSEVKFSVAVAGFAQLLRGGNFMENFAYDDVIKLAQENKGADEYGYRNEFIQLVRKAKIAK